MFHTYQTRMNQLVEYLQAIALTTISVFTLAALLML